MSKKRRGLKPNLERFEGRIVCSGLLHSQLANALSALTVVKKTVSLHGALRGQLHSEFGIPDDGRTFSLSGSGLVAGIGRASIAGNLQTTGFIAQGHAHGTLTLALEHGRITLELTGSNTQSGFAGLPSNFTYTVTSGTGRYRNVTDHGIAALTNESQQGAFTLTLRSSNTKIAAPAI